MVERFVINVETAQIVAKALSGGELETITMFAMVVYDLEEISSLRHMFLNIFIQLAL